MGYHGILWEVKYKAKKNRRKLRLFLMAELWRRFLRSFKLLELEAKNLLLFGHYLFVFCSRSYWEKGTKGFAYLVVRQRFAFMMKNRVGEEPDGL